MLAVAPLRYYYYCHDRNTHTCPACRRCSVLVRNGFRLQNDRMQIALCFFSDFRLSLQISGNVTARTHLGCVSLPLPRERLDCSPFNHRATNACFFSLEPLPPPPPLATTDTNRRPKITASKLCFLRAVLVSCDLLSFVSCSALSFAGAIGHLVDDWESLVALPSCCSIQRSGTECGSFNASCRSNSSVPDDGRTNVLW